MFKGGVVRAVVVALLIAVLTSAMAYAQEEVMELDISGIIGHSQRPTVTFKHEMHMEIMDCIECHHIYEYEEGEKVNVWEGEDQFCADCHGAERDGDIPSLRNAFHKSCVGCHREYKKRGEAGGPTSCGRCHVHPDAKPAK